MGKRLATLGLFIAALLSAGSTLADDHQHDLEQASELPARKPIQLLLGLGLTAGGDDLLKAEFDNGTSQTIEAGGLMDMKVGAIFNLENQKFSLQTSIGYFFDNVEADNGDASFSRIPVELLGFFNHRKHRFGLGVSHHTNVEFDANLPGARGKIDLDDSTGTVLEYGYQMKPALVFALRAVSIDYQVGNNPSIDGNHLGLYVYLTL